MGCPPAQLQGIAEEHRLRLFKGRVNAGAGIGGRALKRRRLESSEGDEAASRSFPSDCNGIVRQRQRHERAGSSGGGSGTGEGGVLGQRQGWKLEPFLVMFWLLWCCFGVV
jgi:hypothetical protein